MAVDRAIMFALATSETWERFVRTVPLGRRLAWRAASTYVAGPELDDAVLAAEHLARRGISASIDQFGEQVGDSSVARRVTDDYVRMADRIGQHPHDTWLSVDLSHLGLDIDARGCADQLAAIASALPDGRRIQVGAEDHARADAVLRCVLDVARRGLADRLGATVQANLRRAADDVGHLIDSGVHVRLVKGAYLEAPDRAVPYGEPTDVAFLRLAHRLAAAGAPFSLGTHDAVLQEALHAALGPVPVEQLLGVRPETTTDLVARGVPVRIYVPFGSNWFRYWMRRVAESRGA